MGAVLHQIKRGTRRCKRNRQINRGHILSPFLSPLSLAGSFSPFFSHPISLPAPEKKVASQRDGKGEKGKKLLQKPRQGPFSLPRNICQREREKAHAKKGLANLFGGENG